MDILKDIKSKAISVKLCLRASSMITIIKKIKPHVVRLIGGAMNYFGTGKVFNI